MSIIFTILLLVLFIAVVASLYTEGMWGNAISLINMVTAGLLATNFYEPTAKFLEGTLGLFKSYTFVMDFLSLWLVFSLSFLLLRTLTDKVSRVKVRFVDMADKIGSVVFACLVGWVFLGFTLFTLHTAPLSKSFMFGGFSADKPMVFGLAPDRSWISFARSASKFAYSRSTPVKFDPHGKFQTKYATRRADLEANMGENESLSID